jgi:hypothetical protein
MRAVLLPLPRVGPMILEVQVLLWLNLAALTILVVVALELPRLTIRGLRRLLNPRPRLLPEMELERQASLLEMPAPLPLQLQPLLHQSTLMRSSTSSDS